MNIETNLQIQQNKFLILRARLYAVSIFLIPLVILLVTYPPVNRSEKNNSDKLISEIKNPFSDISITAKAAYVWDVEGQRELYAKDEKEPLPLASLTKITTALVALDESAGTMKVKITSDSIRQEGDSGLNNMEEWKLKDLIDFSLVSSSNDGMYAVASAVESIKSSSTDAVSLSEQSDEEELDDARENFINKMNKKAKDISLSQTFYLNETGLDASDSESGGYGSAEDMAKLFAYVIKDKPELLEPTAYGEINMQSLDGINHTAKNTNDIVGDIPNLIGSKTGYTDLSGGNLVIAFDSGLMKPIIISVLGSTRDGRFDDVKKLVEATMNRLANEENTE
ncbi:MAG: hypothetical protein AAB688_00555 [Patescibacteria group bacterium]